jgi:nucleotide-binding universal stress UspA family protein
MLMVEHNAAKAMREFGWKHKTDLIVVGSKGKTAAAAVLLGSVTENLIRMTNTPLLAVKRKGETMNLLKAFFTR